MSEVNLTPYEKVEYTDTPDGEGGFTKTETATSIIYMRLRYHENTITARCRFNTVVTIKNLIRIDDALYEVLEVLRVDGGLWKDLQLARQDRPIEPVEESS